MPIIYSIGSSAVVVGFSMVLLALAVSKLGRNAGFFGAIQVLGLIALKLAILFLGLQWIAAQTWFKPPAVAVGATFPLAMMMAWGLRTKRRIEHA